MSDIVLPLTVLKETAKQIRLGWTPPAGAEWYTLFENHKRVSNHAPVVNGIPYSEALFAKVLPIDVLCEVQPTPGVFGLARGTYTGVSPFAARIIKRKQAAGELIACSTMKRLVDVIKNCDVGSRIDAATMPFYDYQGAGFLALSRGMSEPTEIVNVHVSGGSTQGCIRVTAPGWRIRTSTTNAGLADGIKLTDDGNDFEAIEHTSMLNKGNGYFVSGDARDWSRTRCRSIGNGKSSSLDHGSYTAAGGMGDDGTPTAQIVDEYAAENGGYDYQFQYDNLEGLLVSMPTGAGGGGTLRGGMVASDGCHNVIVIGPNMQNAAPETAAGHALNDPSQVQSCRVEGGSWWNCDYGYVTAPGFACSRNTKAPTAMVPADLYEWIAAVAANGPRVAGAVPTGCNA